jgi:hypothetical protein
VFVDAGAFASRLAVELDDSSYDCADCRKRDVFAGDIFS